MQGKYSYKGNMSCLDACPAEYYAATGLVCLKYSDNPPASLLGMTAISFISSSILKVVVLFN